MKLKLAICDDDAKQRDYLTDIVTAWGKKNRHLISHRLASCRFCDKIAVFDEGRIVQVGTHEELLENTNGKYFELWNAQASYYA